MSASSGHQHRQSHLNRAMSPRQELRQRRANVLFVLTLSTCATLFLAATTHANVMMYTFAISFLALCGYCYKLVQLKQYEQNSQYADNAWFRAA
jgi:hypothetical protein